MTKEKTIEIIYGKKSGKEKGKIFIREEDLEIPHGEDYKIAIKELNKIQHICIEGKSIPQLFAYNEISLWWFIYQSLIPEFKKSANFVDQFLHIVNTTNPEKIVINNDFSHLDLIKQICDAKNIALDFSKSDFSKFISKNKIVGVLQKKRYKKITQKKIKSRKKTFFQK